MIFFKIRLRYQNQHPKIRCIFVNNPESESLLKENPIPVIKKRSENPKFCISENFQPNLKNLRIKKMNSEVACLIFKILKIILWFIYTCSSPPSPKSNWQSVKPTPDHLGNTFDSLNCHHCFTDFK